MAIANALAFLFYLGCSAILIRGFVRPDSQPSQLALPVGIMTVLALLFHATDIIFSVRTDIGWQLGLMNSLSIAAWLMALLVTIIGTRMQSAHPGIVVYPLVVLILMLKFEVPAAANGILRNPAVEWHVLLSVAAYSLFTLAAIQAIVLAIQEKHLRRRDAAGLIRKLPPLQTMESALFQLLTAGFILLSLGLVTGLMFIEDIFRQKLAHKTLLSIIAWCVFAALMWGRHRHGWRSKTAVRWTLAGFSFLLLAFVGSKLVLEFILGR